MCENTVLVVGWPEANEGLFVGQITRMPTRRWTYVQTRYLPPRGVIENQLL